MIALIIIGVILVLILCVLFTPFRVRFSVNTLEDKRDWAVYWFGLCLMDAARFQKRGEREKKAKKSKGKKKEKEEKETQERDYGELFQTMMPFLGRAMRRLIRGVSGKKLVFGVRIGDEDAAKCAVNYGRACAVVYPIMGAIRARGRLEVEHVEVGYRFGKDGNDWVIGGVMGVKMGTLLAAGGVILWGIIRERMKAETKNSGEIKEKRGRCQKVAQGEKS